MAHHDPVPVLVRYPQNDRTHFFLCRNCGTHIALIQQLEQFYFGRGWILVKDLVNVTFDDNHLITNGASTVRSFYCKTCNVDMGFKLVCLESEDDHVREGRYLVSRKRLLVWFRNRMHDMISLRLCRPSRINSANNSANVNLLRAV